MIVPITRKEKLLNAIATNGNVDFVPKTREELFLFKILGADVNTPTPITRKEILYQHIIDGTLPTFEPQTRLEKFIMAAAGVGLELPVVLTREEYWWAEISDNAYETITGAIVHFISKRARAIKSLIANISYTQDLNGYDSPWPAGGGKNLLWLNNGVFKTGGFRENRQLTGIGIWVGMSASNYLAPNNIVSYTIGDNNLTVEAKSNGYGIGIECKLTAGQQYTLSWVGTNVYVGISFYDGDGAQLSYVTSGVSPKTFTVPESTANAIIVLRGDSADVTGEFSNVQLEEGQTATAYSPYANICPISGWTGANVTRTGKNLLNSNTITQNKIIDNTGAIVTNNAIEITDYIRVKPGTQYVLSGTSLNGNSSNADVRVNFYTADKTWKYRSGTNKTNGLIFTTDADTYFVRFSFSKDSTDQMCEEGSTATPFVAYNGSTYSITFPAAAGTVYGGTLDVTTGKLTVDRAMVDLGAKNWYPATAAGRTRFRTSITDIERISSPNIVAPMLCSAYKTETANNTYTGKQGISLQQNETDVYVYDAQRESMTTADFKTAMSGVQLCYKLATPQTYQLTPTEVATLLGDNTIWADTGDVTVTY